MIVGFNHNVLYLGVGFHVQTEDGGLKSPSLVTLLYHGGSIISSQKTSYADILGAQDLNAAVEELAKEQHKGMLRRLTKGEFDQRIREFGIPIQAEGEVSPVSEIVAPESEQKDTTSAETLETADNQRADKPADTPKDDTSAVDEGAWMGVEAENLEPIPLTSEVATPAESTDHVELKSPIAVTPEDVLPETIEPAYEPPNAKDRGTKQDISEALDDLIFSYLTGGDEKS